MGITPNILLELVDVAERFRPDGPSIMLGRQQFRFGGPVARWKLDRALRKRGFDGGLAEFEQPDGYCETAFARLGFDEIATMDASDYEAHPENPMIVHDLNRPLPEHLHGKYAFVFDGGTIEHVFNTPMALENVFRMLKPGGRVVAINPLNGWPGHGMYQFTAELIYGFWARMAGCTVHRCKAYKAKSNTYRRDIEDPQVTGHRTRFRSMLQPWTRVPSGQIFLHYEAEKNEGSRLTGVAMQPDYVAAWGGAPEGAAV